MIKILFFTFSSSRKVFFRCRDEVLQYLQYFFVNIFVNTIGFVTNLVTLSVRKLVETFNKYEVFIGCSRSLSGRTR